ncbi:MAG: glycosyltransferase family 39 protein [Candidatus Curtissbacteria bacterium]|nr:glycosyltransferase family 39 protein [Candidatus Curtissbacteria bacterium]
MIFLIGLVAFALRLISLNQSLWLDEGINVNVARGLSFGDLVTRYSLSDFHPPLYHVILKTWITFFGSSEIAVRIPSVILGVGTVFVVYLIAKKLFEEKTALIAATLIATAPLHIYYSQEARMYMLAAFLATLSVYFFISILERDRLLNWLGFIVSTTLMLYSDYLPYLLLPTFFIYIVVNRKRIPKSTIRTFIPSLVLIFALLFPWLLFLPQQLSGGLSTAVASPAWAQVVGGGSFKNLAVTFIKFTIGRISHDNNLIYALLFAPAGTFFAFLFGLSLFRLSPKRSILWYWLAAPIILGFAISFFIPIYSYFRLIFTLGAFYIIMASAINTVNWQALTRTLLAVALAINLVSATIYLSNPKFQRENWRGAVDYIERNFTSKSIVLFESDFTTGPFDYYNAGRLKAEGALGGFEAKNPQVEDKVKKLTSGKNKVFLFQYLSQITDPGGLVFEALSKEGFNNTSTKDFDGVGFLYEFEK